MNKMRTRSRTASQSIASDENAEVQVQSKKKAPQKQNSDVLVASLINSIKEENSAKKSDEKKPENGELNSVPAKQSVGPKVVRGKPKSGRPWKEVKQR